MRTRARFISIFNAQRNNKKTQTITIQIRKDSFNSCKTHKQRKRNRKCCKIILNNLLVMLIFTTLIHKVIRSILLGKRITHLICIIICWKRRRIIRVIHIILWLRGRRLNRRSVRMKRRIRRSWGKRGNRGRIEGWTLISFFIHKIGLWRSFYFVREHSKCIRERGLIRFPWFAALI